MPDTSTTIYQILKAIDVAYENNNFDFDTTFDLEKMKISERRLFLNLENLIEDGYIKGLILIPDLRNQYSISISNPRLTTTGLLFLEENSAMKRAYNTLKEIKGWIPGY